ncbi:MAG: polysaccharide biosynthesis protein [Bacilli bacterium]|nr:polysaccharide biosynthesis protein [Bacilli bacterium]
MKNKTTLINTISTFVLQLFIIFNGFIIPKIILLHFGSDVNGLVASITQFLSYIAIVEGGITGVITASLYRPLVEEDNQKISSILKTAERFYKRIGVIFVIYSVAVAVMYPLFFNNSFSFVYIFTLTLVLSINLLIQYMYSLTLKTLLIADKKVYIVSITQIIMIICNIVLVIFSVKVFPNIHVLKFISGSLFLLQPFVYSKYVKNNYIIDKNALVDNKLISNRWNGFAINIAAFIHFSTDITILTIFTNLSTVSIYSVYSLVTSGLRSIINSISSGINPTIGQLFAKGNERELNHKFELYEYIIFLLVFISFSIAGLLIVPFVMIYTNGVNDTDYYQPFFAILLLISEGLYLLKNPHLNLAYAANRFKDNTVPAFFEAALNIIISVLLVKKYGLIGIAIGTLVGMLFRMIFQVAYTKRIVKTYSLWSFYKKFIIFSVATLFIIITCYLFVIPTKYTISSWIIHGIVYFLLNIIVYLVVSIVFYKKELIFLKKYIRVRQRGKGVY